MNLLLGHLLQPRKMNLLHSHKSGRLMCLVPSPKTRDPPLAAEPGTHLEKPSAGRRTAPGRCRRPARRGRPRRPWRRAARPGTRWWPCARGSGGSAPTPAGCTPAFLRDTGGARQADAAGSRPEHPHPRGRGVTGTRDTAGVTTWLLFTNFGL